MHGSERGHLPLGYQGEALLTWCARHGAERQAWRANAHLNSEIWPTLVDERPSNESGCLRSLENR